MGRKEYSSPSRSTCSVPNFLFEHKQHKALNFKEICVTSSGVDLKYEPVVIETASLQQQGVCLCPLLALSCFLSPVQSMSWLALTASVNPSSFQLVIKKPRISCLKRKHPRAFRVYMWLNFTRWFPSGAWKPRRREAVAAVSASPLTSLTSVPRARWRHRVRGNKWGGCAGGEGWWQRWGERGRGGSFLSCFHVLPARGAGSDAPGLVSWMCASGWLLVPPHELQHELACPGL